MKPANVEQAKPRAIVYQGVLRNRIGNLLAPLPAWLRSRLPSQSMQVFSASELDALSFSVAFRQTESGNSL